MQRCRLLREMKCPEQSPLASAQGSLFLLPISLLQPPKLPGLWTLGYHTLPPSCVPRPILFLMFWCLEFLCDLSLVLVFQEYVQPPPPFHIRLALSWPPDPQALTETCCGNFQNLPLLYFSFGSPYHSFHPQPQYLSSSSPTLLSRCPNSTTCDSNLSPLNTQSLTSVLLSLY